MKTILAIPIAILKLPLRVVSGLLRIVGIGRDKKASPPASKQAAKKAKSK
ncbi:MAG: hypothetical protein O3B84_05140 [Chloroflexi bacterium]|nr:hypothetical protein [Chloroflexota bacterium]